MDFQNGDIRVEHDPTAQWIGRRWSEVDQRFYEDVVHYGLYYMSMWSDSRWHDLTNPWRADFDVRRVLKTFTLVEGEEFTGIYCKPGINQKPLYQQGYEAHFLPSHQAYVRHLEDQTFFTKEWHHGYHDAGLDAMLRDGKANTSCYTDECGLTGVQKSILARAKRNGYDYEPESRIKYLF
ncbi:hypothetical protein KSF_106580 [Reticulibacter mediterranei]|uniref:Uncharacterized protein n=1 Tax=Reticulibacter mediterranei TaxID=2778369 RepID=A0A8J3IY48_9CHLR|nr:hypothetical protein [Reticulibacter mediterranei]GHP00611.1 hypothetical protein KSF_106580 [Reticulibacter mediterranei]